jgi:4-diphosphocytidyl-2-C-methyl-D-erythritol kinase
VISASISASAAAKINLFLHVNGKREDGYHLLESLVAFGDFACDKITLKGADSFSLKSTGPFAKDLPEDGGTNLISMAQSLLQNFTGRPIPCSITLEKNLPIGSGLGGGSSDAAIAVKLMENYFNLKITDDMRSNILVMLGADVPICYHAKTSYFSGIGEVIDAAPRLPKTPILLIWPHIHCSTQDVFKRRDNVFTKPVTRPPSFNDFSSLVAFLKTTKNDLETAAENIHPDIAMTRQWVSAQEGCLLSRMSGSGSTIFGIFEDEKSLQAALSNVPPDKNWWASAGFLK